MKLDEMIAYPLEFPIKVMGLNHPNFAQTMVELVRQYAPDFDAASVEMRASRAAKYISLTFVIRATSRAQLDGLYQALSDHPMVAMAL